MAVHSVTVGSVSRRFLADSRCFGGLFISIRCNLMNAVGKRTGYNTQQVRFRYQGFP